MQSSSAIPTSPTWIHSIPNSPRVYGAGCMFINDAHTHTLIGIHAPRCESGNVRMCGFGGKAEAEEPWWQTAFRETLEELFHPPTISLNLYHALTILEPIKIMQQESPNYVTLVYTLDQLKEFLAICKRGGLETPLYSTFPTSADDLVFGRGEVPAEAEIMHVIYWPLKNAYKRFRITTDFAEDMRTVLEVEVSD